MSFSRYRTRSNQDPLEPCGELITRAKQGTPCASIRRTFLNFSGGSYQSGRIETCSDSINRNHPYEGSDFKLIRKEKYHRDAYVPLDAAGTVATSAACSYLANGVLKKSYGTDHVNYVGKRRAYMLEGYPAETDAYLLAKQAGPEAWQKFKPAKPKVNLGIFIAELREIGGLLFKRLNSLKNLGSNYLAVEFGWKPFIGDLCTWYDSVINLSDQIDQLIRDNNQWIHRSGSVKSEGSSSVSNVTGTGLSPTYYCSITGMTRTVTTSNRIWFSGRFKYFIPGLNSSKLGRFRALRRLWGLEITPSNVYELIPFSWLLDYFINVGTLINNFESSLNDNLVSKYAYTMCTTESIVERKVYFNNLVNDIPSSSDTCSAFQKTIVKARSSVNPFGVQFSTPLSVRQALILGALGLAKS